MATQVLTDCTLWLNQFDLTADVTGLQAEVEHTEIDATTFASGGKRERKAGIQDARMDLMTFWDPELIESVAYPLVGTTDNVLAATTGGAHGDRAYFLRGTMLGIKPSFAIDNMAKLDTGIAAASAEGIVAGRLIAPKATRTSTGTGSSQLDQAVSATQKVYGLAQVFTVAGTSTPTITIKIQSDDNSGFTTPTDRLTFTNFTAAGYELKSLVGPITDTYWRATWTITGTNPQFTFGVCFGIR